MTGRGRTPRPLRDRFEEKVNRDAGQGPNGDCHEWMGAPNEDGYGRLRIDASGKRAASHVAWFLATGAWPRDKMLHRCDNPPCVNVAHLFEGSQADNVRDMLAKGRARVGEQHPHTTLTAAMVAEIRALRGVRTQRDLAAEYGVHYSTIARIQTGKRWTAPADARQQRHELRIA